MAAEHDGEKHQITKREGELCDYLKSKLIETLELSLA